MKVAISSSSVDRMERESLSERNDMGRSWSRAESRLEKSSRSFKESPRKTDRDLRNKLKRSLKSSDVEIESDSRVIFTKPKEPEIDPEMLARREKQLEYGKNTIDYDTYCRLVPKEDRLDKMPRTPNKKQKYSRRQWDGLVKSWKVQIHNTVQALEAGGDTEDDHRRRRTDDDDDDMFTDDLPGTGRSSVTSWADEVEEEDLKRGFRSRACSSTSTDQGLGGSTISSRTSSLQSLNSSTDY